MSVADSVTRTKVPIDPTSDSTDTVGDEDKIRVYYSTVHDTPPMPSVSVIKGVMVDPEKEEALQGWRDRFDGQSQWGRPWFKDQKFFKAYRGTLVHFAILSALGDASGNSYYHQIGDDDWGKEEYWAEYNLKKWSKKAPSANTDEVPYTPRANKYDGEHAWDRAMRGMKWATRTFKKEIIDDGLLSPENVIDVEEYVFDTEYGYGGQFDLLYEDDDGKTILSDVKTSSGVRFGHKLQGAAYKRAVESARDITIDECEVIRLHPDKEDVEVSRSSDWDRTLDGLEHQFLGLADKCWAKDYAEALQYAEETLID